MLVNGRRVVVGFVAPGSVCLTFERMVAIIVVVMVVMVVVVVEMEMRMIEIIPMLAVPTMVAVLVVTLLFVIVVDVGALDGKAPPAQRRGPPMANQRVYELLLRGAPRQPGPLL
jgi:hypothetical protein